MSDDDDQEPLQHRDWTGRPVPERRKRESLQSLARWWHRIPAIWKALTLIAAILAAGFAAGAWVQDEVHSYVLRTDFAKDMAARDDERDKMQSAIRTLQDQEVARDIELKAIKEDTSSMRDDVRQLLNFMLAHPPAKVREP